MTKENGDKQTYFERLVEEHQQSALAYAKWKMISIPPSIITPEDAVQEAFCRLIESHPEGEGVKNPAALLKHTITNLLTDIRRKHYASHNLSRDCLVPNFDDLLPEKNYDYRQLQHPAPGPVATLIALELEQTVLDAASSIMPESQKNAAIHKLLGHSPKESADILGVTTSSATNYRQRGIEKLRALLTRKDAVLPSR